MTTISKNTKRFVIAALCLAIVACSAISILETAITAAQVAIPIIGSQVNLPPAILSTAETWLNGANDALGAVVTEEQSTDTAGVMAAKIVQILTAYASANLPAGTPQAIVNALNAVAADIAKIITQNQNVTSASDSVRSKVVKFSASDLAKLQALQAKVAANRIAIQQLLIPRKMLPPLPNR